MPRRTRRVQRPPAIPKPFYVDVRPSSEVRPEFFLSFSGGQVKGGRPGQRDNLVEVSLELYRRYGGDNWLPVLRGSNFNFSFVPAEGEDPGFWAFTEEGHDQLYNLLVLDKPIAYWTKEALIRRWFGGDFKAEELSEDSDRFYLYSYLLNVIESALTKAVPPE